MPVNMPSSSHPHHGLEDRDTVVLEQTFLDPPPAWRRLQPVHAER
jgi:hypothetical protein